MAKTPNLYTFYSEAPTSERLNEYIKLMGLRESDDFSEDRKIVLSNVDVLLIEQACEALHEAPEMVIPLLKDVLNYLFRDTLYNTKNLMRDTLYYELFPVFLFENESFLKIITYLLDNNQIRFILTIFHMLLLRLQSYNQSFATPKKSEYFIHKWYTKIPRTPLQNTELSIEDEIFAWLDYQDGETNVHPDAISFRNYNIGDEYDTVYDVDGPYLSDVIHSIFVAAEIVIPALKTSKLLTNGEKHRYLKQCLTITSLFENSHDYSENMLYSLIFNEYLELEKLQQSKELNAFLNTIFPTSEWKSCIEADEMTNEQVNNVYLNNQCVLTVSYSPSSLNKGSYVSQMTIHNTLEGFEDEIFHMLSYLCLHELHVHLPLNFFDGVKQWIMQIAEDEEYPSIEIWKGIALSYINAQLKIERHVENRISINDLPFGL